MRIRPFNLKDFYKTGHIFQYPDETTQVYSNLTARMSRIPRIEKTVFFGLQYLCKEYLIDLFNMEFFGQPKEKVIKEYKRRLDTSLGKDAVSVEHVSALHDLGYLPIEIKAVKEGTLVPIKIPSMTIRNTHPDFGWVTNSLETLISMILWKPITSATTAYRYKEILTDYAERTSDCPEFIQWQGHDFSMRGMSGIEDACMSGAGHLLSFTGTDTIPAIDFLEEYYLADCEKELIGGSVPASEHSVACMGTKEGEKETLKRFLTKVYPSGIFSFVSDTWDFWGMLTNIIPELKNEIMNRDGKLTIRPDSGDPVDIICGTIQEIRDYTEDCETEEILKLFIADSILGKVSIETPHGERGPDNYSLKIKWKDKYYIATHNNIEWNRYDKRFYYIDQYSKAEDITLEEFIFSPEEKGAVEVLWEIFGGKINSKGYKELDPHIGLIYGDSITIDRCKQICERLERKGFASTNIVLGIGSYTYEYVTRDTFGMAIKSTYGEINGEGIEIFKDPKTDTGFKKSLKGLLMVYEENGEIKVKDQCTKEEEESGLLEIVFKDGKLVREQSLADIRAILCKTVI